MKTVSLKVVIPADRQLHISVPEEIPAGEKVVVTFTPETPPLSEGTAGDLLRSSLFGIWKDRADIGDSIAFARMLRAEAERRPRG